jgi:hypothetical protein
MGLSKENLEKKNVSAEKYDEIRRLDGMGFKNFEKIKKGIKKCRISR